MFKSIAGQGKREPGYIRFLNLHFQNLFFPDLRIIFYNINSGFLKSIEISELIKE
jgi:hypothetical protein